MTSEHSDRTFDPALAADVLNVESLRVQEAFDVRLADQLAAWGIAWFVGLGLVWLQVRDQNPYRGPSTWAVVTLSVLMMAALVVTADRVHRATAGVLGASARRGRLYGIGWGAGVVAGLLVVAAAGTAGAPPAVIGVLVISVQLVIAGVLYLCGAALFGGRIVLLLGCWLIALGSVAGFAGPVGAAAVGAVGGGGGFLVAAASAWRGSARRR